jgi:hypothetical protein
VIFLFGFLIAMGWPSFSQANDRTFEKSAAESPIRVTLGLDYSSFAYKEDLQPPGKSTENAQIWSPFFQIQAPINLPIKSYFSFEAKTSGFISTNYDGSTLNTGTPVQGRNPALFFHGEADLHFVLLDPQFQFFTGWGYHFWNRFLAGGSGYREIYSWMYIPLGLAFENQLSPELQMRLELSYQVMFNGKIQIITSETIINGEDTNLELGSRPGYKARARFDYEMSPLLSFSLQPWYEVLNIGESNYAYNATFDGFIHEPASQTVQYGLSLGTLFKF